MGLDVDWPNRCDKVVIRGFKTYKEQTALTEVLAIVQRQNACCHAHTSQDIKVVFSCLQTNFVEVGR
eukprot:6460474-Amphidinium_carterae.1